MKIMYNQGNLYEIFGGEFKKYDDMFDPAILGVSNDFKVVYDFDLMVECMMNEDDMTYDEAYEFIDYNFVGFSDPDIIIVL